MLTLQELKKLSVKELSEELAKASKNLFKMKFEVGTGSSKSSHQISNLRKYRAQIKTIEKNIQIEEKANFKSQKEVDEAEKEVAPEK